MLVYGIDMASKAINKLSAKAIKDAECDDTKIKKLSDGSGLYLILHPNGSKYWQFDYRRPTTQKQNSIRLGVYSSPYDTDAQSISLKDARVKRDETRALIRQGVDPAAAREEKKRADKKVYENTLQPLAMQWLKLREHEQKDDAENIRRLNRDVFPKIGHMPLLHITTDIIEREVMQPFIDRGAIVSAQRIKSNLNMIFELARRKKLVKENPVKDVVLPQAITGNFAAIIEPEKIPPLLQAIWSYTATRPRALFATEALAKMAVWCFLRPSELRTLKWSNYDRQSNTIKLMSSKLVKSKNSIPQYVLYNHIIALPTQAIKLLDELHQVTGHSEYLFQTNRKPNTPLSDGTFTAALNYMGFRGQQTPHGLRATARTMLREQLHISTEYIEKQLGHKTKDPNGTAYDRTMFLEQRGDMMQKWADYIESLRLNTHENLIKFRSA